MTKGGINIKVAIHQPNHWPYLGFFDKIKQADVFVIFDKAQFSDGDYHHRNRIRNNSPNGFKWLTVPVKKKRAPIDDIKIDNMQMSKKMIWTKAHLDIIDDCYGHAAYYHDHEDFLNEIYGRKWHRLVDLNMAIINYLKDVFGIKTPIVMGSDLHCLKDDGHHELSAIGDAGTSSTAPNTDRYYLKNLRATQRLIDICKEIGADTYISGSSGKNYMMEDMFVKERIKLEYQSFRHPVYRQLYLPFMPNMSSLDYIMNTDQRDTKLF